MRPPPLQSALMSCRAPHITARFETKPLSAAVDASVWRVIIAGLLRRLYVSTENRTRLNAWTKPCRLQGLRCAHILVRCSSAERPCSAGKRVGRRVHHRHDIVDGVGVRHEHEYIRAGVDRHGWAARRRRH
jgi:hypothetical protein